MTLLCHTHINFTPNFNDKLLDNTIQLASKLLMSIWQRCHILLTLWVNTINYYIVKLLTIIFKYSLIIQIFYRINKI
jgi:hypothetical protein